jgi:hypothetical protein
MFTRRFVALLAALLLALGATACGGGETTTNGENGNGDTVEDGAGTDGTTTDNGVTGS